MSDSPDGHAAAPKKGSKFKLLVLIAVGLLLGGAGLGGYFFLVRKPSTSVESAAGSPVEHRDASIDTPAKTHIISLKPVVVNLRNSKATRFLKVTLGFQTNAKKEVDEQIRSSAEIADFLVNKLSDLEVTDIDNMPGRTKLKREIQNGVNEVLDGGYVSGVFFTEFVIQ